MSSSQRHDEKTSDFVYRMLICWQKTTLSDEDSVRLTIRNSQPSIKQTLICVQSSTPCKNLNDLLVKVKQIESLEQTQTVVELPKNPVRPLFCTYCKRDGHDSDKCWSKPHNNTRTDSGRPQSNMNNQIPQSTQLDAISQYVIEESEDQQDPSLALYSAKRPNPSNNPTYYSPVGTPYSIVEDLERTRANITYAQLLQIAPNLSTQASKLFQATTPTANAVQAQNDKFNAVTTTAIVDGHKTEAVIDSGAAVSIISKNLAQHLQGKINRNKTQRLRGVNATETSKGTAEHIVVDVGGCKIPINLLILQSSPSDLILGSDWSSAVGAIIDYRSSKLQMLQNGTHYSSPISWTKPSSTQTQIALFQK